MICASLVSLGGIYEKAGFYAGVSVGAGYNAGNFSGEAFTVPVGDRVNTHEKISTCCFGKDFSGFVGYMTHLSQEDWLAGVEFGIEKPFYKKHFETTLWDDTGAFIDVEHCHYRVKTLRAAKLHAKLGRIFNEKWFVYGLMGVDVKRTEVFLRQEDIDLTANTKKSLCGIAVGLGVEREICEDWRLGLELVNTYYPARTVKGLDESGTIGLNSKIKENFTQVSLRLIYNF